MAEFSILILAAGLGTRMRGADKLLQTVADGLPLLRDRVDAAVSTGQNVYVALPLRIVAPKRWHCLQGCDANLVEVPLANLGMSHSLIAMLDRIPDTTQGIMVLPADMPDITTQDMRAVFQAFDAGQVVRGSTGTKPGHPVLFPRNWFAKLRNLTGDNGARDLLKDTSPKVVPLLGSRAHTDLDTPEEWAAWRAEKRRHMAKTSVD